MFKLDLKKQRNHRSNWKHLLDHREIKRVPEEHLLLLYRLCQNLWLCGSRQTVENSSRDGNTRPPYLPPEFSGGRCGGLVKKQKLELDMEQQTGSKSGQECAKAVYCHPAYLMYMWTWLKRLSSSSSSRVQHEKCWTGWNTSWNQGCWEKHQ